MTDDANPIGDALKYLANASQRDLRATFGLTVAPAVEPTEAQVTAASEVLWDEAQRPYMASVEWFTREQVLAGELRAADDDAEAKNREVVRQALRAAYSLRFCDCGHGHPWPCTHPCCTPKEPT